MLGAGAAFALRLDGLSSDLKVTVVGEESLPIPDGRSFDVVHAELVLKNETLEVRRLATFARADGALMRIGDLDREASGSYQYSGRTLLWAGAPGSTLNPFTCIAGVVLPASLALQIGQPATVDLGRLATWDVSTSKIDVTGDAPSELTLSRDAPWPRTATWTLRDGRSCALTLVSTTPGGSPIEWGTGMVDTDGLPIVAPVEANGLPSLGGAPVAVELRKADQTARGDASMLLYFREHPDAWVIQANYIGTWGGAAEARRGAWMLTYGDPDSGARAMAEVIHTELGTHPGRPGGTIPTAYVPEVRVLPPKLADAAAIAHASAARGFRGGEGVGLAWFAARNPVEATNGDVAVWQLTWDNAQGAPHTLLWSAADGELLFEGVGFDPR